MPLSSIRSSLSGWKRKIKVRIGDRASIPVGAVRFGSFRRLTPISPGFGFDRGRDGEGTPLDRYYVSGFLAKHSGDIRGRVLEFGDNRSTRAHGGTRVTRSDVLDIERSKGTTIVADIARADHVQSETFDCIIMTHTIQMVYDQRAALQHLLRILKPGGVLLVSTHGIGRVGRVGDDPFRVHWHLTTHSARRLFEEFFPPADVQVEGHGNVLVAMGFLHGLSVDDLEIDELDHYDERYQVLLNVRAVKPLRAAG